MNERERTFSWGRPRAADDEREVRELLVTAGPRSPVRGEDLAAIKAAARREWLEVVAARGGGWARRRATLGLALAASLLVALLGGWWWVTRRAPVAAGVVASVERVTGEFRVGERERPAAAAATGARLVAGALLETGDGRDRPAGRAALALDGGASLRLDVGTRVRLVSGDRLELERGAVYLDSGDRGGGVEIGTTFGVVRDVGTRFEVRLNEGDAGVRVRVRQGEVAVAANGASHSAVAGEELSLGRDGSVARRTVAGHGPEWDWAQAAAPSLDIEGRSLRVFLDWVGRETGRSVRYESPALEASAATIELHGTIADLTPEESLAVVLSGSGLTFRLEDGTLLVARPPAQNS